jgi:hypothetical protein
MNGVASATINAHRVIRKSYLLRARKLIHNFPRSKFIVNRCFMAFLNGL